VKSKSSKKPFIIGIIIVALLGLTVVSFAAGALGEVLLKGVHMPDWMTVERPNPHLPAGTVFYVGSFPVTNTLLAAWISMIFLVVVSYFATRRMKLVPGRFQGAFEMVLGYILNLCEDIAGKKNGRIFFPVVCTIFLFVLTNALFNLIPGFTAIMIEGPDGHTELLRGANTDINFPLALAIIAFCMIEYWGITKTGFFRYMSKFIVVKPLINCFKKIFTGKVKAGIFGLGTAFIEFFIGLLELLSEIIRIVSFTFRLFGNMTGGEILLLMMMFLMPYLLAIPFLGLELFMGFIQALIFAGLTLTFASIASTPHGHEEEAH